MCVLGVVWWLLRLTSSFLFVWLSVFKIRNTTWKQQISGWQQQCNYYEHENWQLSQAWYCQAIKSKDMSQVTDRYGGKGRIADKKNVVKARMPVTAVFTCIKVEQNVPKKSSTPSHYSFDFILGCKLHFHLKKENFIPTRAGKRISSFIESTLKDLRIGSKHSWCNFFFCFS